MSYFGKKQHSYRNINTFFPRILHWEKEVSWENDQLWDTEYIWINIQFCLNRLCGCIILRWKLLPFALQIILCKVLTWPAMSTYFNETWSCLKWNFSSLHSVPLINLVLAFKHDYIPLRISDVLGNFICLIYILLKGLGRHCFLNQDPQMSMRPDYSWSFYFHYAFMSWTY